MTLVELTNAIVSAVVSTVVGGGVVKVWAGKLLERDRAQNREVTRETYPRTHSGTRSVLTARHVAVQ